MTPQQRKEVLLALSTLENKARQFNAVRDLLDKHDRLESTIKVIDKTLRVPAAEYVPAIQDVFKLIDALEK